LNPFEIKSLTGIMFLNNIVHRRRINSDVLRSHTQ
jgi:hypothetical protein